MAIPDFQTIMLPLLQVTSDGLEHTSAEVRDTLAKKFSMTPAELAQPLPSGRQTTFANRVAWATAYLRACLLLQSTGRGRFKITDRGRDVLAEGPPKVDLAYLGKYPELKTFREGSGKPVGGSPPTVAPAAQTPDEAIEANYQTLRSSVEQELIARVKAADPAFFEGLVVQLLVAMGYGGSQEDAGKAIGQTGDGGIDGVIKEDRLGLDTIYLQAKRWQGTVGRPLVQAFVGSLAGQHARRGVMITTSDFSTDARNYVKGIEQRIILINGAELARLMFEFGVGVTPVGSPYVLKRVDLDFFDEV